MRGNRVHNNLIHFKRVPTMKLKQELVEELMMKMSVILMKGLSENKQLSLSLVIREYAFKHVMSLELEQNLLKNGTSYDYNNGQYKNKAVRPEFKNYLDLSKNLKLLRDEINDMMPDEEEDKVNTILTNILKVFNNEYLDIIDIDGEDIDLSDEQLKELELTKLLELEYDISENSDEKVDSTKDDGNEEDIVEGEDID